jgi:hypothetical protein
MQDDDERSNAAQFICLPFPTFVPCRISGKGKEALVLDGAAPCVPVFTDKQRCIAFGAEQNFTVWEAQDDASQLADLLEGLMLYRGAAVAVLDPPPSGPLSVCQIGYAIQRLRRLAPPSDDY